MNQSLKNKRVMITAGPTREYIDPVRYISNDSSGRMGYAMAEAARKAGAEVVLISGPVNLARPNGVTFIPVVSAEEMHKAAMKECKKADIIICSAAVADFRPKKTAKKKIKKTEIRDTRYEIRIDLIKNPDILGSIGRHKRKDQLLIGFALETENIIKNALKKMRDKNCDIIIANTHKNIGSNKGSVTVLDKNGEKKIFRDINKKTLAKRLLHYLADNSR